MEAITHSLPRQVGIIREVEVDITNEMEQQRTSLRDESKNLRYWAKKAEDYAKQLTERNGEPAAYSCLLTVG